VTIPSRPSFTRVVQEVLAHGEDRDALGMKATAVYSALAHAVPDILVAHHTLALDDSRWNPFLIGLTDLEDSTVVDLVVAVLVAYARSVGLQISA
jgi:hypothetical protein